MSTRFQLPAEVVSDASRRLGMACLVMAVLGALRGSQCCWSWTHLPPGAQMDAPAELLAIYFGVALLSLAMFALTRVSTVPPAVLTRIGLLYEVLLVRAFMFLGPGLDLGVPHLLAMFFPVLVPSTPGVTFVVAFVGLFPWPGSHFVPYEQVVAGQGPLVVNLVVACLAAVHAATVCHMGEEVSLARRMGSYTLQECLGQGGMGEVWRAEHGMLARPAAVKLIRPDLMGGSPDEKRATRERFAREAQATAALTSPHTVVVYDFGVTDEGAFYYCMELLDGMDLQTLVERHGPLPPGRVVHLLKQVCASLEEAHRAGLVHRDIKPANVVVCRHGREVDFVKVLDFGLVKSYVVAEADLPIPTPPEVGGARLTIEGTVRGTPGFMAPEHAQAGEVGPAADIYALGCVAFWLLTAREVFVATSILHALIMHATDTPPPPSRHAPGPIPRALDEVILACLEKVPARRPCSARELARRLEACVPQDSWTSAMAEAWWLDRDADGSRGRGAGASVGKGGNS